MTGLLPVLLLGTVLGARHATDADHVVAVTTIVTRQRRLLDAMRIGALWGLGHTATLFAVGGAIILLHLAVPPRLSLAMEFAVALMLIGLGLYNLLDRGRRSTAPPSVARPVAVGVVHGLAGSAAVALLVLAAIPSPAWALGYLILFGVGTIAGMSVVTLALAAPVAWTATRFARINRTLQLVSGSLSVALGVALAFQLTFVEGLFAAVPAGIPH